MTLFELLAFRFLDIRRNGVLGASSYGMYNTLPGYGGRCVCGTCYFSFLSVLDHFLLSSPHLVETLGDALGFG
jgi:hypothetical protein